MYMYNGAFFLTLLDRLTYKYNTCVRAMVIMYISTYVWFSVWTHCCAGCYAYNTLVFPYATLMCVLLLIHGFPKTQFYDSVGVVCICENQRVCKASA